MNLDLSPDGKSIVFELLGHIYKLSARGGKAQRLTSGTSYNSQPRFSPDGKKIVFASDRNGCKNIWIMNSDGSEPRLFTRSRWIVLNLPAWSPNGQYVVYRKRVTDRRSVGTVALWMQHILGGKGIALTNRKRIGDANSPAFSHDGRYLYFAARGRHRYNRNPHTGIWNVQRLELRTRKRLLISRNASKPLPSPDGRWLALLRRIGSKTALLLHDLKSGRETILTDALDFDQQEGFAMSGTYPNYSWSRDSRSVVFTAKGQFWRIALKTRKLTNIPFQATLQRRITHALHFQQKLPRKKFQVRILRWPGLHPKKRWFLWSALGQLWKAPWPALSPVKAITEGPALHYAPSFSKDGRSLLFVSWTDKQGGHIWKRAVTPDGKLGKIERVTTIAGQYINPVFSPDGNSISYIKGSGAWARGLSMGSQPWLQLRWRSLKNGQDRLVTTIRNRGALSRVPLPQFSLDGKRLFFTRRTYKGYKSYTTLHSIRMDGQDEKKYFRVYAGEEMRLSPNQKWVVFRHLHEIYLSPLPPASSKAIALGLVNGRTSGTRLPVYHLSRKASGNWPFWTSDSHIGWLSGPALSMTSLSKILQQWHSNSGQKNKISPQISAKTIPHKATVFQPSGIIALTNLLIPGLRSYLKRQRPS
jgi:Tol biopolymer transport system component